MKRIIFVFVTIFFFASAAFADDADKKKGICAEFTLGSAEYNLCKFDREFLPKGRNLLDNSDSLMNGVRRIMDELRIELLCTEANPCQES